MSLEPGDTITVIGGAGYIGSILVRSLLKEGFAVRVFDNFRYGDAGLRDIPREKLDVVHGDICNTCAVSDAIAGSRAVVLLAAIVGRRSQDIERAYIREVNFLASSVVLDAAAEHGVERFVFASTDSVYGVQEGLIYETTTPEPVSLYSRLKLRMEERVMRSQRRDFHPTALRVCTCHGFSPRMRFDLVANSMVRDALLRNHIRLHSSEQHRAMVHVEDAAQAFQSVLLAHTSLVSGEIFNVGAMDQNVALRSLAQMVADLVPGTTVTIGENEADLRDYRLSSAKIEKTLGFQPRWTLDASIRQLRDALDVGTFKDPYAAVFHNTVDGKQS